MWLEHPSKKDAQLKDLSGGGPGSSSRHLQVDELPKKTNTGIDTDFMRLLKKAVPDDVGQETQERAAYGKNRASGAPEKYTAEDIQVMCHNDGGKGASSKGYAYSRGREKGNSGKNARGRGVRGPGNAGGVWRDSDRWDGCEDWPPADEWSKEWRRGEWGKEQWSSKDAWPNEEATRRDDWHRMDPPRESWSSERQKKEQSARHGAAAGGQRLVLTPTSSQMTSMAPAAGWNERSDWMCRAIQSVKRKLQECKNHGMLKRSLNPSPTDTDWARLAYNGALGFKQHCAERGSVFVGSFVEDGALLDELVRACAGEVALARAFRCLDLHQFFPALIFLDAQVDNQCASLISAIYGELLDAPMTEEIHVRSNARKVAEWALLDTVFLLGVGKIPA